MCDIIYLLSWNIEEKIYTVSGEYESIWGVYYYMKDSLKTRQQEMDIYIWCMDCHGKYINLKTRNPILAEKGYEKLLISKGASTYKKFPFLK